MPKKLSTSKQDKVKNNKKQMNNEGDTPNVRSIGEQDSIVNLVKFKINKKVFNCLIIFLKRNGNIL